LLGRERLLPLPPVHVRDHCRQHAEKLIDPAVADRSLDLLVRLPLGELARTNPREQLFDRAPEREG
jgi:hypothetical protein